MHRGSRVHFLQ